jgi:hypothetical protein
VSDKLTMDTNCLIDVEEARPSAPHIRSLWRDHDDGKIQVRLVGISASERQPGRTFAPTFDVFSSKVDRLGVGHLEILKPLRIWDVTYWDWCIWAPEGSEDLLRDIHEVLFPKLPHDYTGYSASTGRNPEDEPSDGKLRNPMCDVVALWTHIYYGGDVFVTSDQNFHRATKKPRLKALGAGDIMKPDAAAMRYAI